MLCVCNAQSKWITFIRLNKYYFYLIISSNQICICRLIAFVIRQFVNSFCLPCNLVHNSLILRYYSEFATNLQRRYYDPSSHRKGKKRNFFNKF